MKLNLSSSALSPSLRRQTGRQKAILTPEDLHVESATARQKGIYADEIGWWRKGYERIKGARSMLVIAAQSGRELIDYDHGFEGFRGHMGLV